MFYFVFILVDTDTIVKKFLILVNTFASIIPHFVHTFIFSARVGHIALALIYVFTSLRIRVIVALQTLASEISSSVDLTFVDAA